MTVLNCGAVSARASLASVTKTEDNAVTNVETAMGHRIRALEEQDIDRLAASVVLPTFAQVYLGLLQNGTFLRQPLRSKVAAVDGKASSIEAYIDIERGTITVIDNGQGITPESLTAILDSKGSL